MERRAPQARRSGRQVRLSSGRRAAAIVRAFWQRASRARGGVAVAAVAIGLAAWAPQALADFPYVGDGTAGDPSSWALAPGHVPSNLGGLAWKFAATPVQQLINAKSS
jgi:hypothetical protein